MLLILWPLFIARGQDRNVINETVTQRAIREKEISKRRAAIHAATAKRLFPEVEDGASVEGNPDVGMDISSVSDSVVTVGYAPIRVLGHERELSGRLPEALGASITTSDAVQYAVLNEAMKAYAAKQADEDDDMAMIAIIMAKVI